MTPTRVAVLTGDVISSTGISESDRITLLNCLVNSTSGARDFIEDFSPEIFQGDSFQGFSRTPAKALCAGLFVIMNMLKNGFGIRISIAVGNMSFNSGNSLTSDGTAFRLSGRNLEYLKKNDLLIAVSAENEVFNEEWKVHSATLNFLVKRCTQLQAAAILQMLKGKTQIEAAEQLQIRQPAVQQRLQAAGWPLIQTILNRFETQF